MDVKLLLMLSRLPLNQVHLLAEKAKAAYPAWVALFLEKQKEEEKSAPRCRLAAIAEHQLRS